MFPHQIVELQIDKEKLEAITEPFEPLKGSVPEDRYVAFIDILGFSNQLIEKFENTIEIYQEILDNFRIVALNEILILLEQNQKLAQARDLLLPRLMSGAIEV
jgi:hypothetical protein